MPSARRRRFSVQNQIANRDTRKVQNETQINEQDTDLEMKLSTHIITNPNIKYKHKIIANTSKKSSTLEIVPESRSSAIIHDYSIITSDKEVTASSSTIDLFAILNTADPQDPNEPKNVLKTEGSEIPKKHDNNARRDRTPRRERYLHRIKVRSPKRKAPALDKIENKKRSVGTNAVNDIEKIEKQEIEVQIIKQVIDVGENTEEEEKISTHSLEDMCRICHSGDALSSELGQLISTCSCRGTIGRVHVKCLERWLTESGKSRCELCGTKYVTKRVHRFGILKALVMWILSHNSKHIIVDFCGIMIMTPIAVVAAGLTGRTFAGLMAQEHLTPWPLASTFVLACMTLVCYYCWIVSALTRHALGWWIWYRSHYEVRLQLQDEN